MSTHVAVELNQEDLALGPAGTRWFRVLIAVGLAGLGGAFALAATTEGGWDRFYASYLVAFVFFVSLALGALFFVLVQHATRAGWSVAVRRIAEAVAPNIFLPMAFLAVPVLIGLRSLYPWTDHAAVAADHLLHEKAAWLNAPFFMVRAAVYFIVWSAFALWFHRTSVRQDRTGDPRLTKTMETTSTAALILFAFTVFWAYIAFSQYMLMWYANLPEETFWYAARQSGSWTWWSLLLLFGHFLVPFLALMSRNAKRRKPFLLAGALWMLAMQWADVYWLVMPGKSPGKIPLSLMDLAVFVGIGGLFFASVVRRLGAHALVPLKDPRLAESLGFENF